MQELNGIVEDSKQQLQQLGTLDTAAVIDQINQLKRAELTAKHPTGKRQGEGVQLMGENQETRFSMHAL